MIGFLPAKYILTAAVGLAIAIFTGLALTGTFTGVPIEDIKIFAKFVLGIRKISISSCTKSACASFLTSTFKPMKSSR